MSGIQLNPVLQQAREAMARQDLNRAGELCQQALDLNPQDLNALITMADLMLIVGRTPDAMHAMRQAVSIDPENASLRAKVGHLLSRTGEYQKAIQQYERAERLEPDLVEATVGKARALERTGRYDTAGALVKKLALTDGDSGAVCVQVRVFNREGEFDRAIELVEGQRNRDVPAPMWREMLFEAARAMERVGRYDDALACAAEANAVMPARYDDAMHAARIDELIENTSADAMRELPHAENAEVAPIFIIGLPRCGSTLLDRILHAHPDAHSVGEFPVVHRLAYQLHQRLMVEEIYPNCLDSLSFQTANALQDEYLRSADRAGVGTKRIVDKNLGNYLHAGLIELIFPGAIIVHAVREPIDNCLSCYMEPLAPNSAPYAGRLEDLGAHHRQYERLMAHWRAVLSKPMVEIAYEDVVRDQEATTRRLLDACGLSWHAGCLDFHEVRRIERTLSFDQVRQPLYDRAVGRAERFGASLDPLRAALAGT